MIDLTKKTILFYQPDRYTRRNNSHEADAHFEQQLDCNFIVALAWEDFVDKLNLNPVLVGFHCDLFNNEEFGIHDLIRTITTTLRLKRKQADIFVSINKKVSIKVIDSLRSTAIIGINLARGDFGIDSAVDGFRQLLQHRCHWPQEHIALLEQHAARERPLHIYFRDDLDTAELRDLMLKITANLPVQFELCKSWSDLSVALDDRPHILSFHIDMVLLHGGTVAEFMMMLDTMMKYSNVYIRPNIAVAIEPTTHVSTIKELQKHRIMAIIPCARGFGVEPCRDALTALLNNTAHWPKNIIAKLPGNEAKLKNKNIHSLTGRQQEVYDLIANRGLSNKQIARVLTISESTVKIHVSAVMKNLCVRNRTQLALTK